MRAIFFFVLISGFSLATAASAAGKKKAAPRKGETAGASAGCEVSKDFTERFESTNKECKSKISGGIVGTGMGASQCSNISDGIQYSCQDGNGAKIAKAITKVCCHHDPKATKVKMTMNGTTMHAYFNIDTVNDPSQGIRCQLAKQLKLKNSTEDCSKHL